MQIIKTGTHVNWNGENVNSYDLILDESYQYTGTHPLMERDYYEHILEERGLIEMVITDVKTENGNLIISYTEQ